MTLQPVWVILCCLPEKGRKEIEEKVQEIKDGQGKKRNRNESEETDLMSTYNICFYGELVKIIP